MRVFTHFAALAVAALAVACASSSHADGTERDIVDTALRAGNFQTLTTALQAAGLVDTLRGEGPFTVFAPTDAAFAALPPGTVEDLLRPENRAKLTAVLTYHVVPGALPAAEVTKASGATTVNGQRLEFRAGAGGVRVDGVRVATADVACSNGVIHVVDAVLLPSGDDIVATARAAGSFGTLLAAAEAAGLASTLAKGGPFTVFAPTDDAFRALPAGTVERLLRPENRAELVRLLRHHIVEDRVHSPAAASGATLTTLAGTRISTIARGAEVRIGGARIAKADIDASNGVVHVIDTVLVPAS